jgi:predicted dehydrogenase
MSRHVSRRDFLKTSSVAAAAGSLAVWSETPAQESKSPSERLNVAVVGVAGRGGANLNGVATQNLVALCDIDDNHLAGAAKRFPAAKTYNDFRRMLDAQAGEIEAVVVSTADHNHAPAGLWAMSLGKHCYCEKPLTHNVWEAREMAKAAQKHKVVTQMGTQIHAGNNYRRVVEVIRSGAIGKVHEAIVWVGKGWGGGDRPTDSDPVPQTLHWDVWLGPAPERSYKEGRYHPQNWRRWWDFGGGTLGDMACHYCDLPFWALDLRHPTTIEASGPPVHKETCPLGLNVTWEFPARGEQPPVKLTWYDGGMFPPTPPEFAEGEKLNAEGGAIMVGTKGKVIHDTYGLRARLLPDSLHKSVGDPPRTLPRITTSHEVNWSDACKGKGEASSPFEYAAKLTEVMLLGVVALRAGVKIHYDGANMRITNSREANDMLKRDYRRGWSL